MDTPKETTIDPLAGVDHVLARLKLYREDRAQLAAIPPSKPGSTANAMKPKSTAKVKEMKTFLEKQRSAPMSQGEADC